MEWLANAWLVIEPYFMKGIDLLVNSGIGAAIGLIVIKKWDKKHSAAKLSETITENVSKNIVGKNILVSLESVNKKQMDNAVAVIESHLQKDFEIVKESANLMTGMAKIMLKFKAATEDEKQELVSAINKLEAISNTKLTVIEETKPVVIEVEKVEDVENAETDISLF